MSPAIIPLLDIGSRLIDRLIPDPEKKAAAELELLKLSQEGDLKKILGQLEINAREAAHPSIFVAGWRPFVGWTCGVGLFYQAVLHNLLNWVAVMYALPTLPAIDSELLIYVLGAMLGIAGLRTYEKKSGVTK